MEIEIADDGMGIPENDQGKLFDRFYQVKRQTGPGYRGTGIGLCVCKSLLEKMGGEISLRSSPGRGTTFIFTLPTGPHRRDVLFGKIAIHKGYVSTRQLEEAIENQHLPEPGMTKIGELLVDKGYLDPGQRDEILKEQSESLARPHPRLRHSTVGDLLFGFIALKSSYLTEEQLNLCLREQEELKSVGKSVRLGEICVSLGFLSADQCIQLIQIQGIEIQTCTKCQCRYNVPIARGGLIIHCPHCGSEMTTEDPEERVHVVGDIHKN